eukprot:CAMPEP_0206234564 /NCGR_PEP_ID=MMETSP0047_2-20121206/12661_1 /ASSEMBLY_ACC=CAM_ASM_000192 /TAXON_ID=195065 /ORGANISM="Chroomonas mesostigmatica_cf, Strain CCMP1168" /LENGTH=76 /DNA_ID=CAMNT_0053658665 /DNA_START=24 /DNA_END=254 /DNA_ORIENTATION=+
MAARATQNLLRLLPKAPMAAPRVAAPMRGGHGGPDPNAPKWEQAVRRALPKDEHIVFAVIGFWVVAIYGGKAALAK